MIRNSHQRAYDQYGTSGKTFTKCTTATGSHPAARHLEGRHHLAASWGRTAPSDPVASPLAADSVLLRNLLRQPGGNCDAIKFSIRVAPRKCDLEGGHSGPGTVAPGKPGVSK